MFLLWLIVFVHVSIIVPSTSKLVVFLYFIFNLHNVIHFNIAFNLLHIY